MTRADKNAKDRHIIRVRYYGGTYVASGAGKRASCTSGPHNAALTLARKLFKNRHFNLVALAESNTWRATLAVENDV